MPTVMLPGLSRAVEAETSDEEYNAFKDWAIKNAVSIFGWRPQLNITRQNYRSSPEYREWINKGFGLTVSKGTQERGEAEAARRATAAATGETEALAGISPTVRWESMTSNGYVWRVGYDKDGNIVEYEPVGQAQQGTEQFGEEPQGEYYTDSAGNLHRVSYTLTSRGWDKSDDIVQFAERTSKSEEAALGLERERMSQEQRQFEAEQELRRQQMQQEMQQQQELINWYREQQAAQLEAERQQRLAQLRANPASWLEYASLSGETPAVQPWMVPLAPQDYGMQAGQPLPGWTGEGSLSGLPQLTTPSTQYLARTTPSGRQQYYGYEQARTGARPEDVEWRLWNQAPPGGGGGASSLRWMR